ALRELNVIDLARHRRCDPTLMACSVIGWAIDAKASQLRGKTDRDTIYKRRFAGHPRSFFERGLDHWLSGSQQYNDAIAKMHAAKSRPVPAARAADPAYQETQRQAADLAFNQARVTEQRQRDEKAAATQRMAERNARVFALCSHVEKTAFEVSERDSYN